MKRLLRLFFLLLFLAATTLVLSSSRYVTSVNVHSFLYEEETGYRIDVIYPGPQVFWTVITLTDTKNFLKRIRIVDQLTSVYLDNIPSKMDLKVESFSGGQAFFGSVSLSRKSARSDLSILLSILGKPSAVVLLSIGLAITVDKLRVTDAISRKSGLVALWWAVLIVAVSTPIGVSYYVGLFPLDPVISQTGALSFPEDRPGALPEAEYTFLKETFHKLLDGVPSIIDRYYKLVNTLEEVEGGPIQNEEKSRTISLIKEELEKIEPTIYRIVEALQTIIQGYQRSDNFW